MINRYKLLYALGLATSFLFSASYGPSQITIRNQASAFRVMIAAGGEVKVLQKDASLTLDPGVIKGHFCFRVECDEELGCNFEFITPYANLLNSDPLEVVFVQSEDKLHWCLFYQIEKFKGHFSHLSQSKFWLPGWGVVSTDE